MLARNSLLALLADSAIFLDFSASVF